MLLDSESANKTEKKTRIEDKIMHIDSDPPCFIEIYSGEHFEFEFEYR